MSPIQKQPWKRWLNHTRSHRGCPTAGSTLIGMAHMAVVLWGDHLEASSRRLRNGDSADKLHYDAYLRYLETQQSYIDDQGLGLRDKTHDIGFLLKVVKLLKTDSTWEDTVGKIRGILGSTGGSQNIPEDDIPESFCSEIAIYTARMLLMSKVGCLMSEQPNPRKYVAWNRGTLARCMDTYFNKRPVMSSEGVHLPKAFDADRIELIAGIKIIFTDNLADHLLLIEGEEEGKVEVFVFHHATFLESQHKDSLLPRGLAEETLRTLALLFPQSQFSKRPKSNRKRRAWLKKRCQKAERKYDCLIDKRLTRCGNLSIAERQIDNFFYWKDRLIILKQAYDEATPGDIPQWWYDRRNGVQWYTFWVAILVLILTVLFGIIQSIEGALQVYKAYYPTQ